MSKTLDSFHRDINTNKLKNEIKKELRKEVESKVISRVQSSCIATAVLTLHDKFGWGKKRLTAFMFELYEQFDSIYEGYNDFETIRKCVYDELGIDFDEIEQMKAEKYKKIFERNGAGNE